MSRKRPSGIGQGRRLAFFVLLAHAIAAGRVTSAWESPTAAEGARVRSLLAEKCLRCHGPDSAQRQAGLRLDQREAALQPADSGKFAIVPGDPVASELLLRIASNGDDRMPPPETGPALSAVERDLLSAWIKAGAEFAPHWSFVPPRRPELPLVAAHDWPRNAIDRFILARIEAAGLTPAPEAERSMLARRLALDLTGLPPNLEELDAFLADPREDAYEKYVDRLLASPAYGEHAARHWLDVARYADTHGYFTDHVRFMWPWRDWAINAFNDDQPFDQFTIEQLAGDLLPGAAVAQRVATGFNRNHPITEETGVIDEEYRVEYVLDRVRTTSAAWLGLTAGCAQCHDHKYDPFSQREFYELFAFFNNVPETGLGRNKSNSPPLLELPTPEQEAARRNANEKVASLEAALAAAKEVTNEARQQLESELAAAKAERNAVAATIVNAMVMAELDPPRQTQVLLRGQYDQPGEPVVAGVPAALSKWDDRWPRNRLGFARWLTSPEHPLTARVAVNRLWQQIFGTGIVRTSEDFGVRGEAPTHPELLDWLAVELIESGWNVKRLQKLIVMSATYRQSPRGVAGLRERDPENRLLARAPRHRLEAEVVRDNALAIAGLLAPAVGGPSVKPYQPAGLWNDVVYDKKNTQEYVPDTGAGLYRRGLYTYWKRQVPPPTLLALDAPTRETCVVRRQRTNTPLQALALLNDPQFVECARVLAQQALKISQVSDAERLTWCFRRATCRVPATAEMTELTALLAAMRAEFAQNPQAAEQLVRSGESPLDAQQPAPLLAAWTAVCQAILNLDETISRE